MFNFLTVVSLSKDKTDKSVKAFLTCVVLKKRVPFKIVFQSIVVFKFMIWLQKYILLL